MKETIVLNKVSKVYPSKVPVVAVQDVSLKIYEGDFVAVQGPSGSGKTTLLMIIGTLTKPTKGKVYINGIDVTTLSDDELAKIRNNYIGFVFQNYNLIDRLNAIENVELPLIARGVPEKVRKKIALNILRRLGLERLSNKKPTEMSGGQQQRVAIARALAQKPKLLLADEPTANLDMASSRVVMETFLKVNKEFGTTIVIVTHENDIAAYARKRIYMRDGKIEKVVELE